jgi:hypothetical protein
MNCCFPVSSAADHRRQEGRELLEVMELGKVELLHWDGIEWKITGPCDLHKNVKRGRYSGPIPRMSIESGEVNFT